MGKKEFAAAALDSEYEIFVLHIMPLSSVILFSSSLLNVYPVHRSWIADLTAKKALTKVFTEYANFANVFSPNLVPKLPIYSLGPVRPFKSPTDALISFDRKLKGFLQLYINYRGPNNLKIKNWFPLPLIGEKLNRLRRAREFIQLNLTSVYYQMRIYKGDKWKMAFETWYC